MAEFYESPAGQALLNKTPTLMQNLMIAIQKKMAPLMDDLLGLQHLFIIRAHRLK